MQGQQKLGDWIKSFASSQAAEGNAAKEDFMSTQTQVAFERMLFRKTNARTGRHVSVTPQNSTMWHLAYGRIILNSSMPADETLFEGRENSVLSA